ncbi:MAG: glutaredoxin family protein [Candidatus Poribacteria bacterium]
MSIQPLQLLFYTKHDCPLCEKAREAVGRVLAKLDSIPVEIDTRDIESNEEWHEEYKLLIPVVEIDGAQVVLYHVHERRLARRLKSAWKTRRRAG